MSVAILDFNYFRKLRFGDDVFRGIVVSLEFKNIGISWIVVALIDHIANDFICKTQEKLLLEFKWIVGEAISCCLSNELIQELAAVFNAP